MKKLICCLLSAVLLAVGIGFAGCVKPDDGVIRLNEVTHSIFYAPQYLAMALGYFEEENITIELINGGGADKVAKVALEAIADEAMRRSTGARALRTIIEEIMLDVMFEVPSLQSVERCIVAEETVREKKRPLLLTAAGEPYDSKMRREPAA